MNSDFRLSVNMVNHPKVKKLIKRCGYESFYSLVAFWSYVAINKPDGDISSLDIDDIEIASQWTGKDGDFFHALCEVGFLDCDGDDVKIHNWAKHNPWVIGSEKRSLNGRKNVSLRWAYRELPKEEHEGFRIWLDSVDLTLNTDYNRLLLAYRNYTSGNTSGIAVVLPPDTSGNTPIPTPIPTPLPTPLPIPIPTPICTVGKKKIAFSPLSVRPGYASENDWADLVEHRKKVKGVNSERAYKLLLGEIEKTIEAGHTFTEVVDMIVSKAWKGYKHEWFVNASQSRPSGKGKVGADGISELMRRNIANTEGW